MPFVTDVYERGLSLNVMSKSYGLPGLRIGWIACADKAVLSRMERMKHYLSICNSGPSERLAKIALRNRDQLLGRNCRIIDENLPKWEAFFERHSSLCSTRGVLTDPAWRFRDTKVRRALKNSPARSWKTAAYCCYQAQFTGLNLARRLATISGLVLGAEDWTKDWQHSMRTSCAAATDNDNLF